MEPIRIACVRYLNTVPLIEGLEKCPEIELVPTVPARIAEMVRGGQADVGLISLVDAARHNGANRLTLLPVGMIGCDGPTMTVRLYSVAPLESIQSIYADTDSHTSVILCQLLLRRLYGLSPAVIPFDARERIAPGAPQAEDATPPASLDDAWPAAVLLIGDKVVTDAPPAARYPHQLDLGEAWQRLTGLPFVYAAWACRADQFESHDTVQAERLRLAAALLDRQLRHNLTRLDWISAHRAPEHRWPVGLASTYLTELLRFRLGPKERQGAERFLAEAAELGLLEHAEVQWADAWSPGPARCA